MKSLFLVLPAVGFTVLGQTELPDMDGDWLRLFGNGATVAILAWYLWYDTRVRTPKMLETFTNEAEEQRATFTAAIDGMRTTFASEQAALRTAFQADQAATRGHYERELSDYKKLLLDNMESSRRAVHDVRNIANMLIQHKALGEVDLKE